MTSYREVHCCVQYKNTCTGSLQCFMYIDVCMYKSMFILRYGSVSIDVLRNIYNQYSDAVDRGEGESKSC